MPVLSLEDEVRIDIARILEDRRPIPFRFSFEEVRAGHRPGWPLAYSFILHELAIFAIVLLSIAATRFHRIPEAEALKLNPTDKVIYLPVLGGGSEGSGHEGGLSGEVKPKSAAPAARAGKGFTYPGPQPILSEPPRPDNTQQTLLQPRLKLPPVLRDFVPLPNIVQMATAAPAPLDIRKNKSSVVHAPKLIEPPKLKLPAAKLRITPNQPDLPEFHPAEIDSREAPKLAMPVNAPEEPAPLKVQKEQVAKKAEKAAQAPRPEQVASTASRGKDLQTLIALSPMPALIGPPPEIPAAEARARFGVSPAANTSSAQTAVGSKAQGTTGPAAIGTQANAAAGNKVDEIVIGAGNGSGGTAPAGGGGVGTGLGTGTGSGKGGTGTEAGHGAGSGTGLGTGSGATAGSGTGAGNGRGSGGFAGITIQGGTGHYGTGIVTSKIQGGTPAPPQTSYGMTISSLGTSGGGLADYGVFSDEKVYTVYLDMRQTLEDPAPAWTLQYAPLREPNDTAPIQGVTPPFPSHKEMPKLSDELLQRYDGRQVVVYALINTEGRFEQLTVKESPTVELNAPILHALRRWVFRPAQFGGKPVTLKALLGITLAAE
ncbi:MAG: hypothetical protein DMG88_15170 [Acidobacteria bacterium]|nr:MAG: hypothetical protein DMG88_15170 [Acidobacteriota bacterium]